MHALNCLSNVSNSHTIFSCRQLAYLFHHLFYSLCLWRHIQPLIYLSRSSVIPQVHCSNHLVHRLIPVSRDTFKMYLKFIHCQLYTPRCQHPLISRHLTHLSISLILPLAPASSYSYITPLHQSRSSSFRSVFSSFLASLISSFTLCTSSSNCSTILVLLALNILLAFSMLTLSLFFLLLSIISQLSMGSPIPFYLSYTPPLLSSPVVPPPPSIPTPVPLPSLPWFLLILNLLFRIQQSLPPHPRHPFSHIFQSHTYLHLSLSFRNHTVHAISHSVAWFFQVHLLFYLLKWGNRRNPVAFWISLCFWNFYGRLMRGAIFELVYVLHGGICQLFGLLVGPTVRVECFLVFLCILGCIPKTPQ